MNKCSKYYGNRKSPLGKHHIDNCGRQESLIDVKSSRQKCDEKQDICIVSKYFPQYLVIPKGRNNEPIIENLGRCNLRQVIKVNITRNIPQNTS